MCMKKAQWKNVEQEKQEKKNDMNEFKWKRISNANEPNEWTFKWRQNCK